MGGLLGVGYQVQGYNKEMIIFLAFLLASFVSALSCAFKCNSSC